MKVNWTWMAFSDLNFSFLKLIVGSDEGGCANMAPSWLILPQAANVDTRFTLNLFRVHLLFAVSDEDVKKQGMRSVDLHGHVLYSWLCYKVTGETLGMTRILQSESGPASFSHMSEISHVNARKCINVTQSGWKIANRENRFFKRFNLIAIGIIIIVW